MTHTEEMYEWFVDGKEAGYDYMLILCHTHSDRPFPVYTSGANFLQTQQENHVLCNKTLEVYDLKLDWHAQLVAKRANYGPSV